MKKTGQLLKDKREAAKLSLSEVALATKINPRILAAIEEGDETRLPAKTFLKGFLRSYAQFLKMDVDGVLRSYHEEVGGPPPAAAATVAPASEAPKPNEAKPVRERRQMGDENSAGLRTAAVVVIVLLIGVIIGVRELIEKYQRERSLENAPSIKVSPLAPGPPAVEPNPAAPAAVAPGSPADVAPVTAPAKDAKEESAAPAPAATPKEPTPPPPAPAAASAPAPAPEPAPKPAPPDLVAKPTEPTPVPVPEATDAKAVESDGKAGKNEIIVEALDKVDVKFKIKGETKKISLGPTQVHTIHSDQPITLDLSDGGAVNIIVNGRERGVPGDLGKPKQITIP